MAVNIPSQIVVKTAAEWALDNTVYSNKRILVTSDLFYTGTDQPRFKFANGVDTWANLDYIPEGASSGGFAIWTFWTSVRFNPTDGFTYYFTQNGNTTIDSVESVSISVAPSDMTITGASVHIICGAASNENVTFEIGVNGVYTAISTTAQLTSVTNKIENYGLSISVSQGDEITVRMVCPTWATNPLNLRGGVNLLCS